MIGQNEQLQAFQDRFRYLYAILVIMATVLFLRLWYLQILKGEEFKQFAEENRLKKIKIEAPRGMVFDRDRNLLLDNHPTFNAIITPQYFRASTPEQRDATIQKLAKITRSTPKSIQDALIKARRQPSFQPVIVKKNLTMDEVSLIKMEMLTMPGVDVATGIRRTNVNGVIGSHLLGYISEVDSEELPRVNKNAERPYLQGDALGKSGIEKQLENTLRGVDGVEYVEVDAFGRKKIVSERNGGTVVGEIPPKAAIPGKNVVLTIDEDLQKIAAEYFIKDGSTGAVVALDPNNGEVLAQLSWPSFDSTEFSVDIKPEYWRALSTNEDKPLRDKTIQDHYSPGSTFKIVSALAGLEEGLINENTVTNFGGTFMFGSRAFHDWKKEGHGPTDVIRSLYRSVDTFYYKLATRLDIDTLARYAKDLGLGARTGIALPGEVPGLMADSAWKKRVYKSEWYPGETLSVIIGQGQVDTTPIQLANMMAGVANGGTIYKPRLLKYVEGQDGSVLEKTEPEILHQTKWSAHNLALVKKGLRAVFEREDGTAHGSFVPGIDVGGKTGSAQVVKYTADTLFKNNCAAQPRRYRLHGIFVGFAPIDDPKIAVAVVAEHSCGGATGAAPMAAAIMKRYLQKLDPEKYGEEALKIAKAEYWKAKLTNRKAPASTPAAAD